MLETWRWFGPDDPVTLENARQAGATGIVTALHHLNQGGVWTEAEVAKRRAEVEAAGLNWAVVESIGVGEEIKTRSGDFRRKIDNYKQSIRNVARAGAVGVATQVAAELTKSTGSKTAGTISKAVVRGALGGVMRR